MSQHIKLNADLGEGAQIETLLMPYLSYCNIACGGHCGDEKTMREVIELAKSYQVKIGAHPSYPDKANFGRVVMDINLNDLETALKSQLSDFRKACSMAGAEIYHVKAHGALYHQIVLDKEIRDMFFKLIFQIMGEVKIMLPAHVSAVEVDLKDTQVIYEVFGDRKYNDQLQLISRSEEGSVLHDIEEIENQITRMAQESAVLSNTSTILPICFDTICLHGDHPQVSTYFPKLVNNLREKGLLPCE